MTKYDEAVAGLTDAQSARFLLDELNNQLVDFNQRKCDVLTHLGNPQISPTALALLIYFWDRRSRVISYDSLCSVVEIECMPAGRQIGPYSLGAHIKSI